MEVELGDVAIYQRRQLDWLLPAWLENYDAFMQSSDESMDVIGFSVLLNFGVLVFCIFWFSIERYFRPKVFSPLSNMFPHSSAEPLASSPIFLWMLELWKIEEDTIIEKGGYDILYFIRFYKLSMKIFGSFAFYAFVVILPVNFTGHGNSSKNAFEMWSMNNIPLNSWRLWFHLAGIFLLTLITSYYLDREFNIYAKHRHNYLRQKHAHLRTVLVQGIPSKLRSTVTLATYFETLYPNAILNVRLCQDLSYLDALVAKRLSTITKLERAIAVYKKSQMRSTVRVGDMIEEVDAIKYYTKLLDDLNIAVQKEQQTAENLAKYLDKMAGATSINVIESFLEVTEIGAVSKMLKRKGSKLEPVSAFQDTDMRKDEQNKEFVTAEGQRDKHNKVSFIDWCNRILLAPTTSEGWRIFREGRNLEIPDEEMSSLISAPEDRQMYLSKAFLTFKTFTAATIARQVLHMQRVNQLSVQEAPESRDIIWENMYISRKVQKSRRFIVEFFVVFLTIVWVAPVTIVSMVLSAEQLRSFFPSLDRLCDSSPIVVSMLQLVQPSAVVILMDILPPILASMAMIEGCVSHSKVQMRVFDRYFIFQVVNVFLVTVIEGSVVRCVHEILMSPGDAFVLLGNSLPRMSGFFTAYILVKAFAGFGMEITRIAARLMSMLKAICTPNLTRREKNAAYLGGGLRNILDPGWFPFGKIYAQDMLLVVICATYACISPLILLAGLCYFAIAAYLYTYQMLYVYEPMFETGGKWWPRVARLYIVALIFAQSTMAGMMMLKQAWIEMYILFGLIVVTTIYLSRVQAIFVPVANQLPFDMATSMDIDSESKSEREFLDQFAAMDEYVQPSMRAAKVESIMEDNIYVGSEEDCLFC